MRTIGSSCFRLAAFFCVLSVGSSSPEANGRILGTREGTNSAMSSFTDFFFFLGGIPVSRNRRIRFLENDYLERDCDQL